MFSSLSVYIHSILQDIHLKQKLPIIVGGTSLYIKMFLEGCSGAPPSTPEGQAKVDDVIMGKSWDERSVPVLNTSRQQKVGTALCLSSVVEVCFIWPNWIQAMHPSWSPMTGTDSAEHWRYVSCLESEQCLLLCTACTSVLLYMQHIVISTSLSGNGGRSVSSFKMEVDLEKLPFQCKCLFLSMPRERLYRRIDLRCEKIIQSGIFKVHLCPATVSDAISSWLPVVTLQWLVLCNWQ